MNKDNRLPGLVKACDEAIDYFWSFHNAPTETDCLIVALDPKGWHPILAKMDKFLAEHVCKLHNDWLTDKHNSEGGTYIPPEKCKEDMDRLNEHERLSSGIEKFHVEKPEVDKIEVDKITPTGEITWVREPTTTCPPVINDTKTYTGVTYMSQEKVNSLHNSIIEKVAEESGWDNPPIGDYTAVIDPRTGKVEVKAVDEAHENKKFAMKLKEIIEDCLKRMPKEDWIEVNFEVKKIEENNTNNTEEK